VPFPFAFARLNALQTAVRHSHNKGLVFRDPDTGKAFSIWEQNMEFRQGRGNGWFLVGVCAGDEDNNEAFTLEIACELIGETPQRDGVQVIHQNEEE
jgi:hypothetical protein